MAQLYALKAGTKHANGRNERKMIRDPRKEMNSDNFTTKQNKDPKNKLFKINSSKANKNKVVSLDDSGVKRRQIKNGKKEMIISSKNKSPF